MTKRAHYDTIIAWANGASVQVKRCGVWEDIEFPIFHPDCVYRIKPKPVEKWQYILKDIHGKYFISDEHYTEDTARIFLFCEKIEDSKITVEE